MLVRVDEGGGSLCLPLPPPLPPPPPPLPSPPEIPEGLAVRPGLGAGSTEDMAVEDKGSPNL